MKDEEILFKNKPYRNDKMINVLKKTLDVNEKFLEILERKKMDIEDRLKELKKQHERTDG
tara:strand:+ start:836 stop:1015 length:180 start_codon:yes stop_codon:yes gene_type:complete